MEQGPGGAGRREGPSVQKHRVGLEQEGKGTSRLLRLEAGRKWLGLDGRERI